MSGRVERYDDALQMTHPDYIVAPAQRDELPMLEPVYPLTAGLSGKVLQKASRQALDRLRAVPEWQEPQWLKAARLAGLRRGAAAPAPADRRSRRVAGRAALAAARLRRAAGRPAGARRWCA